MRVVAKNNCQLRDAENRIVTYRRGDVLSLAPGEEVPPNFAPIKEFRSQEEEVDIESLPDEFNFVSANKAELLAAPWTRADAKRAMKEAYNADFRPTPNTTKEQVIDELLDFRASQVQV
jgi:hypothetical protein